MDTSSINFEDHAGKLPWSNDGLLLLVAIYNEIESVGRERMTVIASEELKRFKKEYQKPITFYKRKTLTDEEINFISKNWHKMRLYDLSLSLGISANTVRRYALKTLKMSHKKYISA